MKRPTAFTLVELLVVMAIILMLCGLLFPVLSAAKASAKQTSTMTRMRQVGISMLMYVEEAGDWPEAFDLSFLVEHGFLGTPELLLAEGDPLQGDWSNYVACLGGATRLRQSYFHPFQRRFFWNALQEKDPNAGFLACRTHSRRTDRFTTNSTTWCRRYVYFFTGSVIRVRKDGSAKVVPFDLRPDGSSNVRETWTFSRMFIDVPLFP